MIPPMSQAILKGLQDGTQQAPRMLPSPYQPKGTEGGVANPWQGQLDGIIDSLLGLSDEIRKKGGDTVREEADRIMQAIYTLTKVNSALDKKAEGNTESNG